MKISKIIGTVIKVYLTMCIVPPVINGAIQVSKASVKLIKKSGMIKEIKKDFELRRQDIITVDYQEIDD